MLWWVLAGVVSGIWFAHFSWGRIFSRLVVFLSLLFIPSVAPAATFATACTVSIEFYENLTPAFAHWCYSPDLFKALYGRLPNYQAADTVLAINRTLSVDLVLIERSDTSLYGYRHFVHSFESQQHNVKVEVVAWRSAETGQMISSLRVTDLSNAYTVGWINLYETSVEKTTPPGVVCGSVNPPSLPRVLIGTPKYPGPTYPSDPYPVPGSTAMQNGSSNQIKIWAINGVATESTMPTSQPATSQPSEVDPADTRQAFLDGVEKLVVDAKELAPGGMSQPEGNPLNALQRIVQVFLDVQPSTDPGYDMMAFSTVFSDGTDLQSALFDVGPLDRPSLHGGEATDENGEYTGQPLVGGESVFVASQLRQYFLSDVDVCRSICASIKRLQQAMNVYTNTVTGIGLWELFRYFGDFFIGLMFSLSLVKATCWAFDWPQLAIFAWLGSIFGGGEQDDLFEIQPEDEAWLSDDVDDDEDEEGLS